MWDLTVDGAHSFFVGSGGVLVHNCTPFGNNPQPLKTLMTGSYVNAAGGQPVSQVMTEMSGGWDGAKQAYQLLTGSVLPEGVTNETTTVDGLRISIRPDSSGGWPTIDVFDPAGATLEKMRFK
jgi:hypothetical protein